MGAATDLPQIDANAARLYALVARVARKAVVFRRGPSRRVRMLVWNLASDTLEPGQWLKGRVYERRCDLSPNGELVACFVATHRAPYAAWTTISHPPWFTALALWPKGDCWGGGGLFESDWRFRLNHRVDADALPGVAQTRLASPFVLPRRFRVEPLNERAGSGEDDPIMTMRMIRDGWAPVERESAMRRHGRDARFWITLEPPRAMRRPLPASPRGAPRFLRLNTHAIFERQGRWRVETATIEDAAGRVLRDLGRVDFADLDHTGDILFGAEGRLRRLPAGALEGEVRTVADLGDMTFEALEPPAAARAWR